MCNCPCFAPKVLVSGGIHLHMEYLNGGGSFQVLMYPQVHFSEGTLSQHLCQLVIAKTLSNKAIHRQSTFSIEKMHENTMLLKMKHHSNRRAMIAFSHHLFSALSV